MGLLAVTKSQAEQITQLLHNKNLWNQSGHGSSVIRQHNIQFCSISDEGTDFSTDLGTGKLYDALIIQLDTTTHSWNVFAEVWVFSLNALGLGNIVLGVCMGVVDDTQVYVTSDIGSGFIKSINGETGPDVTITSIDNSIIVDTFANQIDLSAACPPDDSGQFFFATRNSSTGFAVPKCVTSVTVECFGEGAGSGPGLTRNFSGGGGGGAYSSVVLDTSTDGALALSTMGGFTSVSQGGNIVCQAEAGQGGDELGNAGLGGDAANGIGDILYSGGDGGTSFIDSLSLPQWQSCGGGGGSAGPGGHGQKGEDGSPTPDDMPIGALNITSSTPPGDDCWAAEGGTSGGPPVFSFGDGHGGKGVFYSNLISEPFYGVYYFGEGGNGVGGGAGGTGGYIGLTPTGGVPLIRITWGSGAASVNGVQGPVTIAPGPGSTVTPGPGGTVTIGSTAPGIGTLLGWIGLGGV